MIDKSPEHVNKFVPSHLKSDGKDLILSKENQILMRTLLADVHLLLDTAEKIKPNCYNKKACQYLKSSLNLFMLSVSHNQINQKDTKNV